MKNILHSHVYYFILSILAVVCMTVLSCSENDSKGQYAEVQPDSATVDVMGEVSYGDSVTSAYLREMIHSGRRVLLNFCYCCDCKITKPMLQSVVERSRVPVTLITVDVKEHFDLAEEYGLSHSPYYVLYDASGEKVDTLSGFTDNDLTGSEAIEKWLTNNVMKQKGEQDED